MSFKIIDCLPYLSYCLSNGFYCLFFSLFLSFDSILSVVAQNRSNIMVGNSLTAGNEPQAWISPSGDFAFGFHKLENNDLYLLAIWYNKIFERQLVWFARGGDDSEPPLARKGSKVELNSNNGLLLTSPEGEEIWKPDISMGNAAYGFMNDTGNFRVASLGNVTLWQSFDHPTDTLLPGQLMNKVDNGGPMLSSRLRANNFSLGRFQFRLIPDGNAVLNVNNLPTGEAYEAYFWCNTVDSNASNAGKQVVFNESGYLYVLRENNERKLLSPERVLPATEYYHRVTLNFDGVMVQYSYPKNSSGNGNWSSDKAMPLNICEGLTVKGEGTGPCGFNSVCQLSVDNRPICTCPKSFSLLVPDDEYGGCKPNFDAQFCGTQIDSVSSSLEDYDFEELGNINWPYSDYERYKPYNVEECKEACRKDCFCNVIVFNGVTCWKKKLPLSNGRQDTKGGRSFIKVRKGNLTEKDAPFPNTILPNPEKDQNSLVIIVSTLLGGSVFVNFLVVGAVSFYILFLHHKKSLGNERAAESNLRYFRYKELMEATDGFKEELGRGFFGIVYKGKIKMGSDRVTVAIKKLDRIIDESDKEFKTEVDVIGQTHHKNLLKLIGFCDEGQHRLLVYEFLSNGALSSFLYGDIKLCWNQRTQIALGIARGLLYLHEECSTQIIHCDIKPQNILLDDNYDAKIADFGLAKLMVLNQSRTFTNIRGTKGYVAVEWFRNIPITVKVDVYSFGVVLLEIICCRRNADVEKSEEKAILTDWAYDCYAEGNISSLIEDEEDDALKDLKKLERFVMVAIWCIQEDPNLRPTMKIVLLMLEGIVQVPVPPSPYPISIVS